MKQLIVLTLIFNTCLVFSQNIWVQRDSVNGPPRGACASFELNGEAFVVTGVNVEEFKRKMYSYDLEQDDWDDEIALGGETGSGMDRASAVGFSARGYGYVAMGSGATAYMKDLWRYDPETESWTQMADFTGTARNGAIAFSIDHIGYVGTGQDEDGLNDDFYKYDPLTNTWSELSNFQGAPRKEAVGFTMGGKGYVGTGRGNSGYFDDFWEYNPSEDEWTQKADFPGTPRMGAVGCAVFPSAFIMLGEGNDFEFKDDVWEYNYFGNVWTQRADYLGGARTQANAIVVDQRIFVGLGYDGMYHDDFYEYERVLSVMNYNDLSIELFPNPVTQDFTIRTAATLPQLNLRVFSYSGQEVTNAFTIEQKQPSLISGKIANPLPPGQYILVLQEENTLIGTKKIIIK